MVMKQMPSHSEQMYCINHSSHNNTDKGNGAGDVVHLGVGPDHCQEELGEFEKVHERVMPAIDDSCVVVVAAAIVVVAVAIVAVAVDSVRIGLDVFLHDLGDNEVE